MYLARIYWSNWRCFPNQRESTCSRRRSRMEKRPEGSWILYGFPFPQKTWLSFRTWNRRIIFHQDLRRNSNCIFCASLWRRWCWIRSQGSEGETQECTQGGSIIHCRTHKPFVCTLTPWTWGSSNLKCVSHSLILKLTVLQFHDSCCSFNTPTQHTHTPPHLLPGIFNCGPLSHLGGGG